MSIIPYQGNQIPVINKPRAIMNKGITAALTLKSWRPIPQVLIIGPATGMKNAIYNELVSKYHLTNLQAGMSWETDEESSVQIIVNGLQMQITCLQVDNEERGNDLDTEIALCSLDVVIIVVPERDPFSPLPAFRRASEWRRVVLAVMAHKLPSVILLSTELKAKNGLLIAHSLDEILVIKKLSPSLVRRVLNWSGFRFIHRSNRTSLDEVLVECATNARWRLA